MARSAGRRKGAGNGAAQMDLFATLQRSQEARARMRAILAAGDAPETTWRGWGAVPAGTFLSKVVSVFEKTSDIPLEIPLGVSLAATSAELIRRGITAEIEGVPVSPRCWLVLLAESGLGKTTAADFLLNTVGAQRRIADPVSVPALIESVQEADLPLWYRDEWGMWVGDVEHGTRRGMKSYLLELYSGRELRWRRAARAGRDQSLVLPEDEASISFLGTTVGSTLYRYMSADSLLDGFAARYHFMFADPDLKRPMADFPIYYFSRHAEDLERKWVETWRAWDTAGVRTMQVSGDAQAAFIDGFAVFSEADVPPAFVRRLMWGSLSFAMAYQANIGPQGNQLSEAAVEWSGRLTGLLLRDAMRLFRELNQGDFARTVLQGLNFVERYRKRHKGRWPSRRELIAGVRGIKNAQEAQAILSMCIEGEGAGAER